MKTDKLAKKLLTELKNSFSKKTSAYDTAATVTRIEDGTAWVHIDGGVTETPCKLTIDAKKGDTVQVRVSGGKAWITGNQTAPPTDDTAANTAINKIELYQTTVNQQIADATDQLESEIEEAIDDISDVEDVRIEYCLSSSNSSFVQYGSWSTTVPTYVSGYYYWIRTVITDEDGNETESEPHFDQNNQLLAEVDAAQTSTENHFWYTSSAGAVVSNTSGTYSSGSAVRITSSGLLQYYNNNILTSWTSSGIAFYDTSQNTLASFGSGGTYLYDGSGNLGLHASSSSGLLLYDSGTLGAQITSSGMTVYSGGLDYAFFGSTARIGRASSYHVTLSSSYLGFYYGSSRYGYIHISSSGLEITDENSDIIKLTSSLTRMVNAYATGYISAAGYIYCQGEIEGAQLVATNPSTGTSSTANCRLLSSAGVGTYEVGFVSSSSSRRYKHDIKPIETEDLDPHRLYDAEVVQFTYNTDYVTDENDTRYNRPVAGFIAEDLQEVYPMAVDVENGRAETWNERYIIPPMLALIQEQNERIKALEEKTA